MENFSSEMWKWRNQKELIMRVNKRPLSLGVTLYDNTQQKHRHNCLEKVKRMAPWVENMPLTTIDLAVHKSIERIQESVNTASRTDLTKYNVPVENLVDHQLFPKLDHLSHMYRTEQG